MVDVEETIKRLASQKGVTGVIVMDSAGISALLFFFRKPVFQAEQSVPH